jgi:hypothetical protein
MIHILNHYILFCGMSKVTFITTYAIFKIQFSNNVLSLETVTNSLFPVYLKLNVNLRKKVTAYSVFSNVI